MSFCTVLHSLKSPVNVGTIVRSHVAFGGREVVFVGYEKPWSFKKRSQAFSRRLERSCELIVLQSDHEYFAWAARHGYSTVAIEISCEATPIQRVALPERTAIAVGNERSGLSESFLASCQAMARIPQYGPVGSLNVAVAAGIAMHELHGSAMEQSINGTKFAGEPAASGGSSEQVSSVPHRSMARAGRSGSSSDVDLDDLAGE